jgi:hypothetical protein
VTAAKYPLATRSGVEALHGMLAATEVWRSLTKPQRELLLSTVGDAPIKARSDVTQRLLDRGLLVADPIFPEDGNPAAATDAGRFVVAWRLK